MLGDGANDSLAFDRALCRGTPVIHRGLLEKKADFYYLGRGIGGIRALFAIDAIRHRTQSVVLVFSVVYNVLAVGAGGRRADEPPGGGRPHAGELAGHPGAGDRRDAQGLQSTRIGSTTKGRLARKNRRCERKCRVVVQPARDLGFLGEQQLPGEEHAIGKPVGRLLRERHDLAHHVGSRRMCTPTTRSRGRGPTRHSAGPDPRCGRAARRFRPHP